MTTTQLTPFIRKYPPLAHMLDADLAHWVDMYRTRSERDREQFGAVSTLLAEFQQFADDYVEYLTGLLEKKLQSPTPPDDPETFKEAFRYELTQRLVDEWVAISAVVEQRELGRYQTWLTKVDATARTLLASSIPTGVIAYLGPSTTLRHMPYSSISIASIPRETYPDLVESEIALAHEVGHHVWRVTYYDTLKQKNVGSLGGFMRTSPRLEDRAIVDLLAPWLEEMFADVFGAVKLGEPFATSMIVSLKERTRGREDLLRNDGQHPLPYLRPILRLRAMQIANIPGPNIQDLLQDWRTYAGKYLRSDDDRILKFETLSPPIFSDAAAPQPRQSVLQLKRRQLLLPTEVSSVEVRPHIHQPIFRQAPLDKIEIAVDRVIEDILLPLVPALDSPKVDYAGYFTLDWLVTKYLGHISEKLIQSQLDDLVLLFNSLSTLLAKEEEGIGTNYIYVTHDHDGKRHTHNPDGSITTAA